MKEIPPHRIIYIMGTGRSGTTILEILLSANNDICSVGELTHIFRDGFGRKKSCACGQPFNQCVFWSRVNKYLGLSQQMFLKCRYLFNRIDWHLGFLKQLFMAVSDKKTSVYNQINNALYKACADASGKPVIVDSSKYPSRALMLSKLYGGSAKIICLTRSPEGLFAAFKKNDIEQPAKSSLGIFLYYAYVLLCCRITALITKNVFFITFEELIMYPVKTIKKNRSLYRDIIRTDHKVS